MRSYFYHRSFIDTPEEKRLLEESRPYEKELQREFRVKIAKSTLHRSLNFWLLLSLFVESVRIVIALLYNYHTYGADFPARTCVVLSLYWWVWSITLVYLLVLFLIRRQPEKFTGLITFMGDTYMLTYLLRGVGLAAMEVETGIVSFSLIAALFIAGFAVLHRPVIVFTNLLLTMLAFTATALAMELRAYYDPTSVFNVFTVALLSCLLSLINYRTAYMSFLKEKRLLAVGQKLNALNRELAESREQIQAQNRQLSALSHTDSLTGVQNRLCFTEDGTALLARAAENRMFCTLAIADIDNFKHINDTYGHTVGDRCLQEVGKALRAVETEEIRAYRFGGDEFLILFAGKSRSEAFLVLNRFSTAVSNVEVAQGEKSLRVSVGIYSAIPTASDTLDGFLEKADRAMYKAKAGGKNRIMTHYEAEPQTSSCEQFPAHTENTKI